MIDDVPTILQTLPDGRVLSIAGKPSLLKRRVTASDVGAAAGTGAYYEAIVRAYAESWDANDGLAVDGFRQRQVTTLSGLARAIEDAGVTTSLERAFSLEDAAQHIEAGMDVLLAVNAGYLDSQAQHVGFGEANTLVLARCVARDIDAGMIVGFIVEDLVAGSERLAEASILEEAWLNAGGWTLVADGRDSL